MATSPCLGWKGRRLDRFSGLGVSGLGTPGLGTPGLDQEQREKKQLLKSTVKRCELFMIRLRGFCVLITSWFYRCSSSRYYYHWP